MCMYIYKQICVMYSCVLFPLDSIDGSTNRRFSASVCVSTTVGLSPVSIRRANSDKMKHNRLPVVVTASLGGNGTNKSNQSSLQRAPSMDVLDDRMNQSTVGGTALPTTSNNDNNTEYSSDEDEVTGNGSVSPNQGMYIKGASPAYCSSHFLELTLIDS